ncbi:MAG: carbonic anhydrase [Alphaproteobacteria bacterium]|nr:carbonic anhydrase [Alphaproteobacteria bacterium]
MRRIDKLIEGYKEFHTQSYSEDYLKKLAEEGQSPEVLVIACSDSRVDPSIITKAQLGEIFVIRNVANLVPPYSPAKDEYHGTSAAIEFAVKHLNIRHIVVMGHSRCAGIRALVMHDEIDHDEYSFIRPWVNIAKGARDKIQHDMSEEPLENKMHACAKESLKISLKNLQTFPWIKERINKNELAIHGWYFNLRSGILTILNKETGEFEKVIP